MQAAATLEDALLALAKLDKSDLESALRAITEVSAIALQVERVSVWWLIEHDSTLACDDLWTLSKVCHERGARLNVTAYPAYFEAIRSGRILAAPDARNDPKTAEFRDDYLVPLGITSMLDVPIWRANQLVGILCHEHCGAIRHWKPNEIAFAGNLADLVTAALEARDRRRAEGMMGVVVESVQEPIFVFDENRTIESVNRAGQLMALSAGGGFTMAQRRELIEYRNAEEEVIPFEDSPESRAFRGEVVRDEIVGIYFKRVGFTRYYRANLMPIIEAGHVIHVIAAGRDVSDDIAFERLKRDFLVMAAHELRSPLTVIRGYAEHMRRSSELPATWGAYLDAITRRSEQMDRVIGNLLDLASIQLGRLLFCVEQVEINGLVEHMVDELAETYPDLRIEFIKGPPAWVSGDRARIKQVVRELCTNAFRYSPADPRVRVRISWGPGDVVLTVEDRGIGIPLPIQDRVWQPFFRAHAGTEHDRGGLGLGLFLVQEIVHKHGGQIWLDSEEGRGTTVRVRLAASKEAP